MAGRKQKNDLGYPDWILGALAVLKPPEKLTVSQWADKYRILSELDSAAPGHWRTSKTPYLKKSWTPLTMILFMTSHFAQAPSWVKPALSKI